VPEIATAKDDPRCTTPGMPLGPTPAGTAASGALADDPRSTAPGLPLGRTPATPAAQSATSAGRAPATAAGRASATPAAPSATAAKSSSGSTRLAPTALARVSSAPPPEAIEPAADPHTDAEVAAELAGLRPAAPARSATDPVLALAQPPGTARVPVAVAVDVIAGGDAASSGAHLQTTSADTSAALVTSDDPSGSPLATMATEPASEHSSDRDDDDLAAVTRSPLASALALVTGSRRNLAIAGGAVLLLVVVLAVAAGSGGKPKPASSVARGPTGEPAASKRPERANAELPPRAPAHPGEVEASPETVAAADRVTEERDDGQRPVDDDAAREPLAATRATKPVPPATKPSNQTARTTKTSTANTATASKTPSARTTARTVEPAPARSTEKPARASASNPAGTLGGKPVVLEYDEQAKDLGRVVPNATRDDQIAIQRARAAYVTGTQRLRSGDGGGAVTYFKQSLAHYPGYVAGYRGLGLAYDKQGDAARAAQALRTYVGAAPGARDASPLRTRIATLSSQSK
jgi:hypothetical protein